MKPLAHASGRPGRRSSCEGRHGDIAPARLAAAYGLACVAGIAAIDALRQALPGLCGGGSGPVAFAGLWRGRPDLGPAGAAATFLGMWIAMTIAMMLPSVTPLLWRRYRAARHGGRFQAWRTAGSMATGYVMAWILPGSTLLLLSAGLGRLPADWLDVGPRGLQLMQAAVLLLAAGWHRSRWRTAHLSHCRADAGGPGDGTCDRKAGTPVPTGVPGPGGPRTRAREALTDGLRLGLDCCGVCAGICALMLAFGPMHPGLMGCAVISNAIERMPGATPARSRSIAGSMMIAAALLAARAPQ